MDNTINFNFSGIDTTHHDFQGRAIWGYDALNPQYSQKTDDQGHGTHVAGIIIVL